MKKLKPVNQNVLDVCKHNVETSGTDGSTRNRLTQPDNSKLKQSD